MKNYTKESEVQLINNEKESNEKADKHISVKTANHILICIIFVLLAYILGMQIIDSIRLKAFDELSDYETSETETAKIETDLIVNINTDNIYELTLLDGIGMSKAEAIFEYRKENGDFVTVDELKNVKGIGEALFENIKNNLTVE